MAVVGESGGGRRRQQPQPPQNPSPPVPSPFHDQAQRDVMLGLQPGLNDLANQRQQAEQDYARGVARTDSAYGDFGQSMAPLGPQFQQQMGGIEHQLGQQIQGLSSYFQPTADMGALADAGGNPGEYAAANALYGSIGAGGYQLLAGEAGRNAAYQTSALRQGAIDHTTLQNNYLQDLQDVITQLRQNRTQQMAGVPASIAQREDQLRQQHVQNKLSFMDERLKRKTVDATLAQTGADRALASDTVQNFQNSMGRRKNGGGKNGGQPNNRRKSAGGSANSPPAKPQAKAPPGTYGPTDYNSYQTYSKGNKGNSVSRRRKALGP